MSAGNHSHINVGAYEHPFSGVGIEFYPLGSEPQSSELVLHETGYLKDNSNWNFPSAYGGYWRLYHNFDPGHCLMMRDEMFELNPECIMLIPEHQLFHCLGQQPVRHFWMSFSILRHLQAHTQLPILLAPKSAERELIAELCRLIGANSDYKATEEIRSYSIALLKIILCRQELHWQPNYPTKLAKAVEFIKDHISENISIKTLAEAAGASKESLYRQFREHLHTSPNRHIRQLRIGLASRLLIGSELSIDSIALRCGFSNRNYFSKVFHDVTGDWPVNFRRHHSSDDSIPPTIPESGQMPQ